MAEENAGRKNVLPTVKSLYLSPLSIAVKAMRRFKGKAFRDTICDLKTKILVRFRVTGAESFLIDPTRQVELGRLEQRRSNAAIRPSKDVVGRTVNSLNQCSAEWMSTFYFLITKSIPSLEGRPS